VRLWTRGWKKRSVGISPTGACLKGSVSNAQISMKPAPSRAHRCVGALLRWARRTGNVPPVVPFEARRLEPMLRVYFLCRIRHRKYYANSSPMPAARFRARLRDMESMHGQNSSTAGTFSIVEIDSNGVDRAQIRRQLRLSPGERLRSLESFLASVIRIRRGIRRPQVSRDPHPAR
jgi:hypothetical protein